MLDDAILAEMEKNVFEQDRRDVRAPHVVPVSSKTDPLTQLSKQPEITKMKVKTLQVS